MGRRSRTATAPRRTDRSAQTAESNPRPAPAVIARAAATPLGLALVAALALLAASAPAAAIPAPDAAPDAAIDVRDDPVAPNESVTLDASNSTAPWALGALYAWDLDDDGSWERDGGCCHAGSLALRTVNASFAEPGVHAVRLHFTDHEGDTDVARDRVAVSVDEDNEAPDASFYVADPDPRFGEPFALRATSRDGDGVVVEHRWDLDGDGAYDDATGANVTVEYVDTDGDGAAEELDGALEHTFDDAVEEHDVAVLAVDDSGGYDTATRTVAPLVGEDRATERDDNLFAPRARIDVHHAGDAVAVNETVTLDAGNSSDASGLVPLYAWDLDGDGSWERNGPAAEDGEALADWDHHGSLGLRTVDVSFDEPGVHPVTLRVEDDHGAHDLVTEPIRVEPADAPDAPTPGITQHPAGADGDAVQLIASLPAETDVTEHEWDTDGDGVTDALGPTATAAPGTEVALTIETDDGDVARNATTVAAG